MLPHYSALCKNSFQSFGKYKVFDIITYLYYNQYDIIVLTFQKILDLYTERKSEEFSLCIRNECEEK